jgi:hypothetical protein
MTLEEEVRKKQNHKKFRNMKMWRLFQHCKKMHPRHNIWKYNHKLNWWGRKIELQS